MPGGVTAQRERLMDGLTSYNERYTDFSRRFAVWLGLHSTDAAALLEIFSAEQRGAPLSPARLSGHILLSSGATTALLNRLEGAGHIVRTREHADRRVVTLHGSVHIRERADEFFGPLAERIEAMISRYPPELLQQFESFLAELCTTMDAQLARQNRDI